MAVIKLIYYLIAPRKFYVLLRRVCRHELLLQCEVFPLVAGQALSTLHFELFLSLSLSFLADLPIAESLRQQVETIMNRCWLNTRRQLLFYLFTCIAIVSNYFITSFVINFYRYFTQPHGNYEVILRKLAYFQLSLFYPLRFSLISALPSLYPGCMDKGMTFPYYHIPLFLESANLYVCGMGKGTESTDTF